jgi:surfeit locus 1 family protein
MNDAANSARGNTRGLLGPGIAAAIVCAILIGLGTWQVERLAWKEKLIADVTARIDTAPRPAPGPDAWADIDFGDLEYRPVSVSGVFQNDREIHVTYALTAPKGKYGGFGAMVMTPFVADAGWTVYVNRGFVPEPNIDPATRPESAVAGHTTVTGLIRRPADRAWFMPGDDVAKNAWTSRDPKLYAAAQGLPPASVAPYIIDANFDATLPRGMPQGGETVVSFPNNHFGYALTWYGLAACCAAIYIAFVVKRLRGIKATP